jgi:tetratricopeptide (TPR) repeat protein
MSRFSSLEFDEAQQHGPHPPTGESIRDGGYFCREAQIAFLHGDFELALRNFSRALESNAALLDAWAGQIRMLIELGEYPEAMVWADKALESFPDHPELIAAKAVACVRDAKPEKAIGFSDFSISRENVGPWAWLARAEVLMQRKSRIAEECLHKALIGAGSSADLVRLEAARIFVRYGRYASAKEILDQSVRIWPKSALCWYELGRCLARLGFPNAKVSLQQALYIRPHWALAKAELDRLKRIGLVTKVWRRIFAR